MANGHGGYRPGAGRKPAGYKPPQEKVDLDAAKARKEAAQADLYELDLRIKSGQYVDRAAVQQATATALATLAQSLRSVPDYLERVLGVSPEVAEEVGRAIDSAMDDAATEFQKLAETPPAQGDDIEVSTGEDEEYDGADLQ